MERMLHYVYPFSEFSVEWIHRILDRGYYIPTERIIKEPGMQVPLQARIYETRHIYFDGKVVPESEYTEWNNYMRSKYLRPEEVYAVEVWVNEGDDGHCCHRPFGFFLTNDLKDLEHRKVWFPSTNKENSWTLHNLIDGI